MGMNYKVAVLALALVSGSAYSFGADFYFALGDSIAYGYQPTDAVRTNGDRGYVKAIADRIGELSGTRPSLFNFAIPAETSSSFYNTSNIYSYANLNYPGPFDPPRTFSQAQLFGSTLSTVLTGGNTVSHVSLAFGANDLLALLTPSFLALTPLEQQTQITATLTTVGTNYEVALTQIRAALPNAQILMPGFYNPNPAGSPLAAVGDYAVSALNTVIQGRAALHGGTYVDFFSPIQGNQLSLTWIGDPNYGNDIHPNDAGYAVLGRAAATQVTAVPEPMSLLALGLGALGMLRRKSSR